MYEDDFLKRKLEERRLNNSLRQLRLPNGKIDFCSNDYLGIVKNNLLITEKLSDGNTRLIAKDNYKTGSTGSRLLAGNYRLIEETELMLADFHQSETALIFNSGYDANVGVLSCIPQRGDVIIYDFLSHASARDGIRLSLAQSFSFAHNDLDDLEKKLQHACGPGSGNIFVFTESVFSMDGDFCPLQRIVEYCKKYKAHLVIDEAHATGVVGEKGEGMVQKMQLQKEVFCRIHTFGKGVGCHGAVVLGSAQLRNYLVNFARSFIYSTALPEQAIAMIRKSYQVFPGMSQERKYLEQLINLFQRAGIGYERLPSSTPIQIVIVPGNEAVKVVADLLQNHNLDVRPILYPTVPKGKERLRVVLHAFNTEKEVHSLIQLLNSKS